MYTHKKLIRQLIPSFGKHMHIFNVLAMFAIVLLGYDSYKLLYFDKRTLN